MRKQHEGMTLLEIILVLTIGGAILYLSMMQYLSYRRDTDVFQVQANVNALFQAMGGYYKQQCFGTAPNQVVSPGKLNPASAGTLPTVVPIDIPTDLVDTGFLTTTIPTNPLVKAAGAGTKGYVVQFNLNTVLLDRQVCMRADYIGPPGTFQGANDPDCSFQSGVGKILTWRAQVSIQLNDPTTAKQYLQLLQGDCLSSASGNTVLPCRTSGNKGSYVVWERIPTNSNTQAISPEWVSTPRVNFFTQMYTTYPILSLTARTQPPREQYYLCGN